MHLIPSVSRHIKFTPGRNLKKSRLDTEEHYSHFIHIECHHAVLVTQSAQGILLHPLVDSLRQHETVRIISDGQGTCLASALSIHEDNKPIR